LRGLARRADLLIEQANQLRRKDSLEAMVNRRFSGVALVLTLLFFASLLWLVIHQQSKHRREVRGIRNRLAADLHDDLGSNLSTISIYVQRLRRQLDPTPECIDPMQRLIRESVGSLKEMVSFTTPQISRPISLVERLKEIADIHCADMPQEFLVAPGLEEISVSSFHRRSLRLFLKEAIHNAMRHSGADKIEFSIRRDAARDVWLSIRDNGRGLPSEVLSKDSSLPTLRLRAEEMNARFSVSNPPDGGCEIAVSIRPLSLIPGPLE
jgi:signal transduction histidine kinase